MRSTFVICVASVAVSLVSAQNKASITYFQDPGCRNSSTTVVQVSAVLPYAITKAVLHITVVTSTVETVAAELRDR